MMAIFLIFALLRGINGFYFRDQLAQFPYNKEVLGRVLGPVRGKGNEMAQWILKANDKVVPRRTARPLHVDEINSKSEQKKRDVFDDLIRRKWGTSIHQRKATILKKNMRSIPIKMKQHKSYQILKITLMLSEIL